MLREITVKSALHWHQQKFASNYDLNIYRGCEHGCKYCFAQYSQKYLESDFFGDVFIKTNIAEILDAELSKKTWKGDLINISGVCDCYQPLEEKYQLMPKVLKVLIKHRNPTIIITKSSLILRDLELIKELSSLTRVDIATSIATLDDNLRQKMEPMASPIEERLKVLEEFSNLNCATGVLLMPIIPYLTDDIKNLEGIYRECKKRNVDYVIPATLHLRGNLKRFFYNFLQNDFPETYEKIQHLYKGAYINKSYSSKLHKFLKSLKTRYQLYSTSPNAFTIPQEEQQSTPQQLDLFKEMQN